MRSPSSYYHSLYIPLFQVAGFLRIISVTCIVGYFKLVKRKTFAQLSTQPLLLHCFIFKTNESKKKNFRQYISATVQYVFKKKNLEKFNRSYVNEYKNFTTGHEQTSELFPGMGLK